MRRRPVLLLAAFVCLAGCSREQPAQDTATDPEARAYVRLLDLSDVQIKATESALGGVLVEITGNVANKGERTVTEVLITCVFTDPYGREVRREQATVVRRGTGDLAPGQTRPFRLPFENLPGEWNQGLPRLVVARIGLR